MSLTFKLLSLGIRTAAKPIGNYIKRQATEHEGFRHFAIAQAQRVHRIDMRLRLGLLHDPEAQKRMHDREQRAAEEKKRKAEMPTVRSEEEQKKYDEVKARGEAANQEVKKEKEKQKVKIRPLSDARAIELGANFFSEAFIFLVAVTLILAENYRSSRKSSQRRDEVEERLDALDAQVEQLQKQHHLPELEALNEKIKDAREARKQTSWYNPAGWWKRSEPDLPDDEDEGIPGEVEGSGNGKRIAGSVPGPSPEQAIKLKTEAAPVKEKSSSVETRPVAPLRVDSVQGTKKER